MPEPRDTFGDEPRLMFNTSPQVPLCQVKSHRGHSARRNAPILHSIPVTISVLVCSSKRQLSINSEVPSKSEAPESHPVKLVSPKTLELGLGSGGGVIASRAVEPDKGEPRFAPNWTPPGSAT
eukprot:6480115-Amphidinium_carterae.2